MDTWLLALWVLCRQPTASSAATISNVAPLVDSTGRPVLTGEADLLLAPDGAYYMYVDDWGGCEQVDCCKDGPCWACCPDVLHSPCVYQSNHSVTAYRTTDWATWDPLGVVLPPSARAQGTLFRPHVVYNRHTRLYVMWFENYHPASDPGGHCHFSAAVSERPDGGFVVIKDLPNDG
eukprot:gene3456-3923_t